MENENQMSTRPVVPAKFGGKWIAWNVEETEIVASAATMEEVLRQAEFAGIEMPPIEYVPPSPFAGGSSR